MVEMELEASPVNRTELISEVLRQPKDAIMYSLSRALASAFPSHYVLETDHWAFDYEDYAEEGLCTLEPIEGVHSQRDTDPWDKYRQVNLTTYNAWYRVEWEGEELEIVAIGKDSSRCREIRHFLIARSREIAERFFLAVGEWNAEVRGEVLVYNGGWSKDAALFKAIQNSVLDNLILEGDLKEQIREDFDSFFAARETYERYGIPWKRGVLLFGPPGNGKTHCIKALVNRLGVPCLYVRTFAVEYGTEYQSIAAVFARARETAPCLLVLEDLDSILSDSNRSFFLNELDGFSSNSGLLIVATTNHPERLDPALLERPSRFDRKYTFNLPDHASRKEYLMTFSSGLESSLHLDSEAADGLANLTENFSFAYLKELFLSAMMEWIHDRERPFAEAMRDNVEVLRGQMATGAETTPVVPSEEGPFDHIQQYMSRWMRSTT